MKKEFTFEEAREVMDYLANKVITEQGIDELNLTKCWESSCAIQEFCCNKLNACPLKTTAIGFQYLTHCFDIVSVSPKYSFIIDLTYKQFDVEKYPLGIIDGVSVYIEGPAKSLSERNKKELKTMGYIPLTKENLVEYLYSFIKPYKDKFRIDEKFVLEETFGIIKDYGISLCDIDDFIYNTDVNINENQK